MSNKEEELEVLRRLHHGQVSEKELLAIFQEYQSSYRVQLGLVQHPRFPAHHALNIIPRLFLADLIAVIKNPRSNPFVRKRAELDFKMRLARAPLGEKLSLLKAAPYSLLLLFSDEKQKKILEAIFGNANCTEDLVLRFLNRPEDRAPVYEVLDATTWHTNPSVALAIAHDPEAPIKMLIKIIPYAGLTALQEMIRDEHCHSTVRSYILQYLQDRLRSGED